MLSQNTLAKKKKDPDLKDKSQLNSPIEQEEMPEISFNFNFDDEIDDLFSNDQNYFEELDNEDFFENPTLNDENFQNTQQAEVDTNVQNLQIENSQLATNLKEKNSKPLVRKRAVKRKLEFSHQAKMFRKHFYHLFTSRKRISKKLVMKIHDEIRSPLQLPKMGREAQRNIGLYFIEFSQYSNQILIYLQNHNEDILRKIPEMRNLKI